MGYSPGDRKELDTSERLTHTLVILLKKNLSVSLENHFMHLKSIKSIFNDCLAVTFHFHVLEKEMATHSSVLAWGIPETGEPGGLPSMGSHRVGHD